MIKFKVKSCGSCRYWMQWRGKCQNEMEFADSDYVCRLYRYCGSKDFIKRKRRGFR